MKHNIIS